jgi:hypothetical protein
MVERIIVYCGSAPYSRFFERADLKNGHPKFFNWPEFFEFELSPKKTWPEMIKNH